MEHIVEILGTQENILHVIRDCPAAIETWLQVILVENCGRFFARNLYEWIESNLHNLSKSIIGESAGTKVNDPIAGQMDPIMYRWCDSSRLENCCSWVSPRHGNRMWIMGYKRFLGECSNFDAELWGIIDKLDLIQNR
ncbi:hypothetical protein Golob_016047 [Gossypium lobatum]|uniref:Uncharacterized protein n=1 Tax=Gossypium lobatum TaxID=34289 RepID=A0A7J8M2Z2_9ROSI|nr:hypothetical protein [Gossypium lobatum]